MFILLKQNQFFSEINDATVKKKADNTLQVENCPSCFLLQFHILILYFFFILELIFSDK